MKRLVPALVLLSFAFGCSDSSNDSTITVQPGESIQAAVDAAPPGGRVVVMPGEYVETHGGQAAVLIEKPLQLIANRENGGVVKILPGPGNTEGIWVRGTADAFVEDVLIEGFTTDGFEENGIWTFYARNFEIRDNNVGNSDHVGIYPQLSAQGLVRDNIAYGGLDSAMWVSGLRGGPGDRRRPVRRTHRAAGQRVEGGRGGRGSRPTATSPGSRSRTPSRPASATTWTWPSAIAASPCGSPTARCTTTTW